MPLLLMQEAAHLEEKHCCRAHGGTGRVAAPGRPSSGRGIWGTGEQATETPKTMLLESNTGVAGEDNNVFLDKKHHSSRSAPQFRAGTFQV